ncbi:hypothetical protein [Streptomyces nanshensis]|uniref:Uncharacterized protein n=1 Tax=Streptomyces nanshensis TaxID=518642 RepID=A0A1E7LAP2_9ACTN|nr:hypothetical protein [Streptomyces nanshensis]OEV13220.1 hypothetical protein AN218_04515 [Streptomyces nanshensis]
MSALLDVGRALADNPIPNFEPKLPGAIAGPTQTILSWTSGGGLALAVLAAMIGWGMSAFGELTERAGVAARAKRAVLWSCGSGLGISLSSSLVLLFYKVGT